MKIVTPLYIFVIIFYLILLSPTASFAWFWSQKAAPQESPVTIPLLEIQEMTRPDQYSQIVKNIEDTSVFVLCTQCPEGEPLERDMDEIPLTIRMSASDVPIIAESMENQPAPGTEAIQPIPGESSELIQPAPVPSENLPQETSPPALVHSSSLLSSMVVTNETNTGGACIGPLYFDLNSAKIRATEREKLKASTDILKGSKKIEVNGYTCDIGTKEYNDKLALRRAHAVDQVLQKMGITVAAVKGEGKCCYVSDDKPKNRRVEITCIKPQ